MVHFIRCTKTLDASSMSDLYFTEVHGIPKIIISDRYSKFLNHFWSTLWGKLGTTIQFSSSNYPQADGQIETVNRSLGNLLRSLIGHKHQQWNLVLTQAEFVYNIATSQTTGTSPYEVVYGRNPISPMDLTTPFSTIQHFSGDAEAYAKHIKKMHEQFEIK